ncbi:hypothetical protein HPP92_014800 [Vanilla planifolia]|uniref:S1 motif domain-containing protein n=1 Tax=Vanilla planifolia TaxID=51239 RepID=A0A835UT26_VANPL|nr:hypothetical protein HPP92_014800 [Vanilla planifolia]
MDCLSACGFVFRLPPLVHKTPNRGLHFSRHSPRPFVLVAASNGPGLNKWDEMELEFGRLIGEDPKLTIAKILSRKENPDVSYLDVEKSFRKNKGKLDGMFNMPSTLHSGEEHSLQSQKPKELLKQRELNLSRPFTGKVPKSKKDDENNTSIETQENYLLESIQLRNAPSSISLRKPSVFRDDIMEAENTKLKIMPNLYLKTATSSAQTCGEITLLKRPEFKHKRSKCTEVNISCDKSYDRNSKGLNGVDDLNMVNGVGAVVSTELSSFVGSAECDISNNKDLVFEGSLDRDTDSRHMSSELGRDLLVGLQPRPTHKNVQSSAVNFVNFASKTLNENPINLKTNFSANSALLGIPHETNNSAGEVFHSVEFEAASSSDGAYRYPGVDAMYQLMEEQDPEYNDWKRAEHLQKLGGRSKVKLISCSSKGFLASFGLLIGFLPYDNLRSKWRFQAFKSWLRRKGSPYYRKYLSVVKNYDGLSKTSASDSNQNLEKGKMALAEEKLYEVLETYEQDKTKYLSSLIGQKLVVSVIHADRVSRRLIFAGKPKKSEELVEKKRILMERLSIGDIVKCCIKRFLYFGLFVEVEGVIALIHHSDISWDKMLDPSAAFKMGQVLEAKVRQLDFKRERIILSLKEVKPDPLMETFESLVECQSSLAENSHSRQADLEWAENYKKLMELTTLPNGVSS